MTTVLQKWGNSQGIRIPKYILDAVHWNDKDQLSISVKQDKLIIERANRHKNIKERFADFHGDYVPEEVNWGEPVGEEVW